jgi:hypothetical protein
LEFIGGGGGAEGALLRVNALRATTSANDGPAEPFGTGGAARFTAGGGGGGDNGKEGEEALTFNELDGLRDDGGGMGGFLPSGGGFGLLSESVLGLVSDDGRIAFRN